jgi:hypothetical protein
MKEGVPMTLKLELSAAEEAELLKKAEEKGVPVEKMFRDVALGIIGEKVVSPRHPVTAEQMRRAFDELREMLPKDLPSIPVEALRRECLYADEEEQPRA